MRLCSNIFVLLVAGPVIIVAKLATLLVNALTKGIREVS